MEIFEDMWNQVFICKHGWMQHHPKFHLGFPFQMHCLWKWMNWAPLVKVNQSQIWGVRSHVRNIFADNRILTTCSTICWKLFFLFLYSPTAECYGVFAQYRFRRVLGKLGRFREGTGSGNRFQVSMGCAGGALRLRWVPTGSGVRKVVPRFAWVLTGSGFPRFADP